MTNLDFHDIFGSQRPAHFCTGQPKSDAHLTASGHFVPGAVGHMRRCFIHWKILTCRATHTHTYIYTHMYINIYMYIYIYIDTYIQYLYHIPTTMKEDDSQVRLTSLVSKPTLVPLLLDTAASQPYHPVARTPQNNGFHGDFP